MTTWTSLFPDAAVLLSRVSRKEPGNYDIEVPAGAKFLRAASLGVGAEGDQWGGGGAYARSRVPVTPGEILKVQVGQLSTSGTPGDSWVKRADGTVICYADRGRGSGVRGVAANSIGDVKYDGQPGSPAGLGGAAANDATDYAPLIPPGDGADYSSTKGADYGGAGKLYWMTDQYGNFVRYISWPGGSGLVALEFYDSDPGF